VNVNALPLVVSVDKVRRLWGEFHLEPFNVDLGDAAV